MIDSKIVQLATEIFEDIERELDEEIDNSKQLSCEDYFKIRFQEKLKLRKENESVQIQTVLDSLMKGFSLFTGDEARFISANLLHMSEEIDGVDITVPQGLSGVLQSLVDELPVNTVRYKRYVNQILWNSGIDNKEVTIYCDFDTSVDEYVADHVIITCPLGHLKQNHEQLFEPSLPNVKIEAIERFEPGKVEAIFLHYEKPFWSKGKGSFFISQERIDGKSSGICSGYESAYWIREIPTCSNVLLIWIYGSDTDHIKSLTDTAIAERCTNLLRQYLGDKDIPEPTSVKITSWCSDPLVHGAYSYLSTKSHATEKEKTLTERGTEIDKLTVKKAWKIIEKIEDELEDGIRFKKDLSCQDYIEKRFTEDIDKRKLNDEKKTHLLMFCKIMSGYLGLYVGDDLKLASANCYEMGGEYDDDNDVILSHGYSLVLKALKEDLTDSSLKFKRNVVSIQWKSEQSTVKVICETEDKNVEEYLADHVIVTCSLGHLKQFHDNLFHPSLPEKKIKAIEKMGFGSVGKIFLYYEIPFWRKEESGIVLAWDSSDDDAWYKSIFKFSTIPTCENVLLAWIHGKASKHMETLSLNEVARTCTDILRKFWKNKEIPEPSLTQTSSWSRDPSFLGAYSYFAVDSHKSCISDIAEPLFVADKPIVCFAGEATDSTWFSYAHGARSSGIREANRILKINSTSK